MPRHLRAFAAVAGAAVATVLLAACSKPTPEITVLGGGRVVTISPSTYCFDATHCRHASRLDLPTFTVAADDKVMVDVPRAVDSRGWVVNALSLDGTKQLGSSGLIQGSHSYRVPSGTAGGNPFVVQVDELNNGRPDGSKWSFLIQVSPTKS